jgi:hypothetical protein
MSTAPPVLAKDHNSGDKNCWKTSIHLFNSPKRTRPDTPSTSDDSLPVAGQPPKLTRASPVILFVGKCDYKGRLSTLQSMIFVPVI